MPNNKKSKCQCKILIVACLFVLIQMAHMAHCIELSVASNSSEVPTTVSSESTTLISSTPSIAVESTHISSSTLNNMPSSTIGSMITASVVIPTSSEEETVVENVSKSDKSMEKMEKESENDDKSVSVGITSFTVEHLSSTASTEPSTIMTTNNNNEKTTTAEPIPSSLPLVQQSTVTAQVATNESDINNVTTMAPQNNNHTNNIVDDPNSNEIHDNEIIDGLSESSKINIDSRVDVVSTNNNKNKKPINIDDFYPSKMEDFKLVIQQSNEKILREKEILRSDEEKSVQNNPLLRPMDLLPIISDKKDLLLEDRSGNTSEIGTTNIEIELIEPDVTKTEQETERETVDITEKLQENDEVIKKIEESFKIDDMDLRPDIIFDIMPSKSSTVPTTIETTTMTPKSTFKMTTSETTTTTVKKLTHDHAPRSHHIPQESGFIPRRVKKNDPKVEGKISVLNRETLKRIDFANTKFKSHSNNNINGAQHKTNLQQQQNTNNNKYKSTGTGVSSAEFSTTKFYNSKETDINKSNDNLNTVVQTTVMASPSEKLMPTTNTIITTTTNSININNNDNNKKSTTIGIVKTDDDVVLLDDGVSATTVSSTSSSVIDIDNNKNSNNKNVVDMSIMANVYPADIVDSDAIKSSTEITQQPTMKIPVFHPLVRPRVLSRLQEKINQLDCDLQSFPPQPPQNAASGLPTVSEEYIKIWRGNETHELSLPIVKLEDCSPSGLDCSPTTISWESTADIQSGDVLLVEIDDSQLISTQNSNNQDGKSNENLHHTPAASVYQVTRPGHEHCDITEGELLDITPLVVDGKKLVTLYDKDLTEGVNFLIVVSELWGQQCVRLKVTVKSDNCGENADCSGKGVCYSNKSMEGYECQCCSGFSGPHCEEIDACTPSPCTNNGICVDLSQGHEGNSYQCLCPYGYTGKNCQFETDPCNPSQCMNGGTCVGNSTHFRCECVPGFTGPLCQHNLNECESSPCVHGICVDQEDGFRCFCQPGFAGELCNYEYNECESNPCLNGGQCIDHISGFSCKCTPGYTGKRCHVKVDFCANDPCPDGHRCIDHGDDFSCECPGGRNGPDCNQVPRTLCNVNPCANGGTCWTTEESFYCACRPGFTGKMCEDTFIIETVLNSNELLSDLTPNAHIGLENPDFNENPFEVHSVYVAIGTLTAAICIVAVVVTACHCKVHQTYRHFSPNHLIPVFMRRGKVSGVSAGTDRHWLSGKNVQSDPENSYCTNNLRYHGGNTFASDRISRPLPPINLDSEMYYTVDFSDSQNSPLIQ